VVRIAFERLTCINAASSDAGKALSGDPILQKDVCAMREWFVPPIIIPIFLTAMIVAYALYRAYG
jgi:hypothetical protein